MAISFSSSSLQSYSTGDYLRPLDFSPWNNSPFDSLQLLDRCGANIVPSIAEMAIPKLKVTWNPPYLSNSNIGIYPLYLPGTTDLIGKFLGNVSPSKSKVFFLSEMHDDYLQNRVRQNYMNAMMHDGDLLLLEGRIFGNTYPPLHTRSFLIKHNITLDGWEHKDKEERVKAVFEKSQTHLYKKVIIDDRNRYMAKIIKKKLLPKLEKGQRIFVIAGARHINHELLKKFPGIHTAVFFDNFPLPSFPSTDAVEERTPTNISGKVIRHFIPKIFEIQLKDGTKHKLESHWFELSKINKVGDKIKFSPDLFSNNPFSKSINTALGKTIRNQIKIDDSFKILSIIAFVNATKN